MSTWEQDLERFTVKLEGVTDALLPAVAAALHESIAVGSVVTGAPGQPVETGNLRASWHIEFTSKDSARIITNVEYAPYVEQGINSKGPVTYRVGGPHGVALTIAGAQRIVDRLASEGLRPQGFENNYVLNVGDAHA